MATSRKSVDAGQCFTSDISWQSECRLSGEGCNSFTSSRELITVPGAHGGNCITSKSTQAAKIGQCGGTSGTCASVSDLCLNGQIFTPISSKCTVKTDKVRSEETKYGSCESGGVNGCFWSADNCDDPSTFQRDIQCTCDKVQVGGCKYGDDIFCAVDSSACDSLSEWIPAGSVESFERCFLCREPPAAAPTPAAPTPPVSAPTRSPTRNPTRTPTSPSESVSKMTDANVASVALNDNDGMQGGAIAGIIAGIVVGGLVVIMLVMYTVRNKKEKKVVQQRDSKNHTDVSVMATTTNSSSGGGKNPEQNFFV